MSVLKDIMANAKAAVASVTALKSVKRARIIGQSLTESQRPAAGIWRAINRPKYGMHVTQTREITTYDLKLVVEICGAGSGGDDDVDDELIDLRDAVNAKLINNSLGGKCAPLEPFGDEASLGITATPGYEQLAYQTSYTEDKPLVT